MTGMPPNNSMQRTALRAAADAERYGITHEKAFVKRKKFLVAKNHRFFALPNKK